MEQPLWHGQVPPGAPNGTFPQRYQVVPAYFKGSGFPMLFYAGPENAATEYTLACLALPGWAQRLGALIVGPEHRYFGESHPPLGPGQQPDYSPVTLHNVLEDYVAVIRAMKRKYNTSQVFVFGGSYGGFLSFMLRLRYPDVVDGSLASAAPTLLYPNAPTTAWYDTVQQIWETKGAPGCGLALSAATLRVSQLMQQKQYTEVQHQLRLCHTPTATSIYTLMNEIAHACSIIPQLNLPFPGANKIGYAFNATCAQFLQHKPPSLEALSFALDMVYNSSKKATCYLPQLASQWPTHRDSSLLPVLSRVQPRRTMRVQSIDFERTWFFISCSYFNLPIGGDSAADSFFHAYLGWSYTGVAAYCAKTYNATLTQTPPFKQSELATASRIIFSYMGTDPVSGVVSPVLANNTNVVLLNIPFAAHTQDICAPSTDPNDEPDVVAARARELSILQQWLKE